MSCVERAPDLAEQAQGALNVELAARDEIGQRRPLDQSHRQEETIRGGLADLVDVEDVRMLDRSLQPALAAESLQEVGVVSELRTQDLQGHAAVKRYLNRLVDLAHPAPAEQLLDPVAVEGRLNLDYGSLPMLSMPEWSIPHQSAGGSGSQRSSESRCSRVRSSSRVIDLTMASGSSQRISVSPIRTASTPIRSSSSICARSR